MPKDVVALEAFAQALENKALYFPQFSQTAVDAFNDALALEPHNALYFLEIGKVRVREASLEKDEAKKKTLILEAKDWFQKSIDKKDNLAEGYFQLGVAQQLLGEKNEAILSLQKAIILDNTKSDYFLVLANIYQSRGAENDYKIAEDIYKKIISAQGNEPNIYLNLGLLYEKMKRFDDALEQYKKVLNLLPEKNLDAKNKIQKMIDNAGQGIENTVENTKE
ncbi:MAG TPA: tetratricopeptide repeat protein [Candidatus Moranbacteria bacterium]|nr:tetratricopeptide repeat protein [Candidatus Moranbacteria bacterium]